jgi:hypothetical protein
MPLYTLTNEDGPDKHEGLSRMTIRAANEDKARGLAASYLVQKGLFEDVPRFADPAQVKVEPVSVQGKQGVVDVEYGPLGDI